MTFIFVSELSGTIVCAVADCACKHHFVWQMALSGLPAPSLAGDWTKPTIPALSHLYGGLAGDKEDYTWDQQINHALLASL
jgi:hypothetical protein